MNLGKFIGDQKRKVKSILDNFEKAKVIAIGTIVTRKNGVREQKTADGWKYLGKETVPKEKHEEPKKHEETKEKPISKKEEAVVYPTTYDEKFVEEILKKHGATTIPFKANKDLEPNEIAAKRELFGYLHSIGVLIGTQDSNIRNGRSKYADRHLKHAVKLVEENDLTIGSQKFLKLGFDVKDSNVNLGKMFEKIPDIKEQHEFMNIWCRIQQKKLGHLVKLNNLLTPKTRKLIIDCEKAGININDTPDNFYNNLDKLNDLMLKDDKTLLNILEFRGHYKMNKKFNGLWKTSDSLVLKNIEKFANQVPNGHLINNPKLLAFGKYQEDKCKYAHYSSMSREIAFSPTAVRQGQRNGDLDNPTEFEHVFTHELGHAVSEKIEAQYKDMFKKFAIMMGWNEHTWNKKATGDQPDIPRANPRYSLISNYAAKSSEECFAEYYSMYVQNKKKIDKYLDDNKDTAVFNTADTNLFFKDGRNRMRASILFQQREVFKFFRSNVFSENLIKAYDMDLFQIYDEFEKGKEAVIGEVRTWKNNRKYKRVVDGWEEVTDDKKTENFVSVDSSGKVHVSDAYMKRKNKDLAKNIESAGYIADYKLTPQEYKFKKAVDDLGFSDFDYEKIKTDLDKLFNLNGDMTVDIEFTGGDDDFGKGVFVTYKATPKNVHITRGTQKITITRAFYIKHGELCVSHDYLNIPTQYQDKGFAKQILKMYHEQYKKIGVTKIDLLANSTVGGYAWGQYGFSINKENLDSLIESAIPAESDISTENWNKYKPFIKFAVRQYFKKNKGATMFPMRLISDMEIDGKKVGKEILLGTQWYGELDLNDVKQLAIFERYLEDETKSKQQTLEALKKLPKTIKSDAVFKHEAFDSNSEIMENYKKIYKGLLKNGLNEHDIFSLAKVEEVNIHDIYPVDKELDNETIQHFIENDWDRIPYAIKIGKGYYLVDGHSRVAGAILQNKQVIKMKTYEYKA